MENTYKNSTDELRDTLLNQILIVSAVFAVIALASAHIRAFKIGWSSRDIMQLTVVCSIVILTLIRKNLVSRHKALLLISFFSVGGFSGFYTLGMLGGTIFIFPMAVVIISVFHSVRTTLVYILATLILCGFAAVKFCSDPGALTFDANLLMTDYLHWVVYSVCLALFFAVTCVTIHNYRKAMKKLMEKINRQRNELILTNQKLLDAANSIKTLSGLLPICSFCKKIRNDKGYWQQLEIYIAEHSEADFSHSICDNCLEANFGEDEQFG